MLIKVAISPLVEYPKVSIIVPALMKSITLQDVLIVWESKTILILKSLL